MYPRLALSYNVADNEILIPLPPQLHAKAWKVWGLNTGLPMFLVNTVLIDLPAQPLEYLF